MSSLNPRILLINDDGYSAEGLRVLEEIARQLSDDVWVVAPAYDQSGKGHSITWGAPVRAKKMADKRYAVKGTPTDAVIFALRHVLRDHPPDYLLSGINLGANLGQAVTVSGTVGAAIEGTIQGVRSISLSLAAKRLDGYRWDVCQKYGAQLLRDLMTNEWREGTFYNVNMPMIEKGQPAGIRVVPHGVRTHITDVIETLDPNGFPCYWLSKKNIDNPAVDNDNWGVEHNFITVSPVRLDLNDYEVLETLQQKMNQNF